MVVMAGWTVPMKPRTTWGRLRSLVAIVTVWPHFPLFVLVFQVTSIGRDSPGWTVTDFPDFPSFWSKRSAEVQEQLVAAPLNSRGPTPVFLKTQECLPVVCWAITP